MLQSMGSQIVDITKWLNNNNLLYHRRFCLLKVIFMSQILKLKCEVCNLPHCWQVEWERPWGHCPVSSTLVAATARQLLRAGYWGNVNHLSSKRIIYFFWTALYKIFSLLLLLIVLSNHWKWNFRSTNNHFFPPQHLTKTWVDWAWGQYCRFAKKVK